MTFQNTPWQNILTALAANRCYACGWPLGSCQPFNCAMRYKEDTQHLVEREGWLERQREMSAALTNALSAPLFKDAKLGAVLNEDGSVTPSRAVSSETTETNASANSKFDKWTDADSLRNAANALLAAAQMLDHNEAIFKGKWKKGSKAWGGEYIERTVADGLAQLRGKTK